MALHSNSPESPYHILDPAVRGLPADEALRETKTTRPQGPKGRPIPAQGVSPGREPWDQ